MFVEVFLKTFWMRVQLSPSPPKNPPSVDFRIKNLELRI